MKNFTLHCLVLLCLGIANLSVAQTAGADSILSFQTMHVHFDKDIYLPGETVWFKAYCYNVNEISFAATNFYAAIYDETGKLIQQKQYPIIEGSCNGDFEIPDTIESIRIQFRAFTKAMIADDSNNIYQRVLNVYNKQNAPVTTAERIQHLQFFPEGGAIVAELQNYIAFKASYPDGSPAMATGQIFEVESNKVIDSFFTDNNGMGKFILIPAPRKKYLTIWKDETGAIQKTPLPVHRYGVSFHAEVVDKELQYIIARNKTNDSLSLLHLVAQMGNYQVYKADLMVSNEMELSPANFSIDSLPPGLMQLTLFDKGWNKLQERAVFINDAGIKDALTIKRDTVNPKPKGKNTIDIILNDTSFTNLSVSVADINFYVEPGLHSIKQELLVNTQLKQPDQNAALLLQRDKNTSDLASLTQQWKKFNWRKLATQNQTKVDALDDYIALSVNYKQKNLALPQDEALNLIVTNNGMGKQFYNVKPESQTVFRKTGLLFFDSAKIAYQVDKNKELVNYLQFQKEETIKIPALTNALPKEISFTSIKGPEQNNPIEGFYTTVHKKFNDVQTIKEVVVKSNYKGNPALARIDELDDIYATGMFKGTIRGFQLNVIDDPMAETNNNLQDYIRYRVPDLKLYNGKFGRYRLTVEAIIGDPLGRNKSKMVFFPTLIFINEAEVNTDLAGDALQLLYMKDIAYVKYIPGIVIGAGFQGSDGALFIYTKTGREKGPTIKGLPFVNIKGYDLQKEFINPDYSDKTFLKQPDMRTTLYWNPNVIMDKANNTVKIDYFNNDVSKKLLLKIEGFNAAGKLVYIEKILE